MGGQFWVAIDQRSIFLLFSFRIDRRPGWAAEPCACQELRVEVKHFSFMRKCGYFLRPVVEDFGVPWGGRYTHARSLKR